MSIPGAASPLFIGAAAEEGAFQIDRSVRLNSADSAYFSRTPSSSGNRKTWTLSFWVKKHRNGGNPQQIFGQYRADTPEAQNRFQLYFDGSTDKLEIHTFSLTHLKTDRVFRDNSAWYHIVLAVDTTLSTADNRMRLYVNGAEETSFATRNNPSQNLDLGVNTDGEINIGTAPNAKSSYYADVNLAEINFVEGSQLAASDFGEYDDNNNWNPKDTSGLTFGTNGFHLDFSDTSDLGADAAGSNDWTPNNLVGTAPGLETANEGFDAVTYSGTGSTNAISLNFQPDFVWIKRRNGANAHALFDSIRGVTKVLESSNSGAEKTNDPAITSFDTNGFTVGGTYGQTNASGGTYAAWAWKAGGTASSNSDGSITSSVSANTTYGFSVVSYTGNGTNGATVGHGLGQVPKWIVIKSRNRADNWRVYHSGIGETKSLFLSTQGAADTASTYWNNTAPTSSVFSLGTDSGVNTSSDPLIAYCWSEVSGFSKFGSYTGNGSATTGPIITTGFKPRYILIKADIAGEDWVILDTARDSGNPVDQVFFANTADAEITNSAYNTEFQVDGFQLKNTNPRFNTSGETYIYAAFASKPSGEVIDSLIDTPTNYTAGSGNNGGNYATANALDNGGQTLSNGNLDVTGISSNWRSTRGSIGMSSGKFYWEVTIGFTNSASNQSLLGIATADATLSNNYASVGAYGWEYYSNNGNKFHNASNPSYGAAYTNGDVIGVAFDADNGTLTFYKNGTSQGTAYTGLTSGPYFPSFSLYGTSLVSFNAGQRPFAISSVPTGYASLCTANLPDPTIADGSTVFDVRSGLTAQFTISDLNFAADLVVAKSTSNSEYWIVVDVVRSFIGGLRFNATNAESSGNAITSVGATGYQSDSNWFSTGRTYATFNWNAGTTTATNNDGSIASSVRANPSAGFSIVTYSGNSTSGATIGHGLNAAPEFVVVKARNTTQGWCVYHSALGATKYLQLDTASGASTYSGTWNNTAPTNSVFTVGNDNIVNTGYNYVAYCFAPVDGYSSFGSYVGTGTSDNSAPFVYTGFRPRFLLWKPITGSTDWVLVDSARSTYNVLDKYLLPDTDGAEGTLTLLDFCSNGFKLRTSTTGNNTSGTDVVWAAFAEHPFKTARAR